MTSSPLVNQPLPSLIIVNTVLNASIAPATPSPHSFDGAVSKLHQSGFDLEKIYPDFIIALVIANIP